MNARTSVPQLQLPVAGSVSEPTSPKNYGPALGIYVAGALVIVSLADTRAAPVAAAFLLAAAIYNANYILDRNKPASPGVGGQSGFDPATGGANRGGNPGGGGGSW